MPHVLHPSTLKFYLSLIRPVTNSLAPPPPPPPLLAVKPAPGRETYGKKMEGVYRETRGIGCVSKNKRGFLQCITLPSGLITLISSTLMLFLFFSEFST
ncbi:hypothetical protein OIU79_025078 [Salix purpurea]|uniref:Uncharacterized protein n=1 Tax=Salix purpurea TaxID=77065 RepID=A0A9Q1A6J3_SALPP|nr:hypothetical protein OIU79_025078 [Salix purpurea]